VDHILPVWEGGGQCDIDNLRTLCVKCHHKVTATQASKRATVRKLGTAVRSGDITGFFQKTWSCVHICYSCQCEWVYQIYMCSAYSSNLIKPAWQ